MNLIIKDMTGKNIESGHIVAVRYAWNSYVGIARAKGLCAESPDINFAFCSPHSWEPTATYQIIGHCDNKHSDYNNDVYLWYYHRYSPDQCPVPINIYKDFEEQMNNYLKK